MNLKDAFNTNKETWNKKVAIHANSDFYDLEGFKRGVSSLQAYEIAALGNVKGKSLLHLQCHFGLDTLSWSRLGAECTGVDFSDEAIKLAREIGQEVNQKANFVCCNVLNTSAHIEDQFDIVFTSYGTIGWLPELKEWAKMIYDRLKPGGYFYIVEFHPIAWMLDYQLNPPLIKYGYQQKEAIYEEYEGTYANPESKMVSKEFGWNHGLGEVINSLAENGLVIEYLNEHLESPYEVFPDLVKSERGMFATKDRLYPLVYELKAVKPI